MAEEQQDEVLTPEEQHTVEVEAAPRFNQRGVAAAYTEARADRKARAADTIKANAKAAQAAKRKALAKAPVNSEAEAFRKRALEIEARQAKAREDKK